MTPEPPATPRRQPSRPEPVAEHGRAGLGAEHEAAGLPGEAGGVASGVTRTEHPEGLAPNGVARRERPHRHEAGGRFVRGEGSVAGRQGGAGGEALAGSACQAGTTGRIGAEAQVFEQGALRGEGAVRPQHHRRALDLARQAVERPHDAGRGLVQERRGHLRGRARHDRRRAGLREANLGQPYGAVTIGDGAALEATASFTSARPFTLQGVSGLAIDPAQTLTVSNVVSGPGILFKLGLGTLTLSGTNTSSGGVVLAGGTLSVSRDTNLGAASGPLAFDGGTLQVTGNAFTAPDDHLPVFVRRPGHDRAAGIPGDRGTVHEPGPSDRPECAGE
ncbi:autotransporter-associated beta strand protein [Methylobacterium sp. OAE515]|uniref:autotransporter-associated beta strand repeat-containing protein n=1 Tax=Methylobacterium sp. OAE515 TaxID=2817895 RepID=UPI0017896AE0